ncbi:MAG: acyl-CoA dehydrogenase family protein [Polyangiaceae bacterium]|nr:acyl-CoA dehydrogenase family protein [Polyangiaceae bacterium]
MISFALSEEQSMVESTVRDFAQAKLAGRAREHEAERRLPDALRQEVHELGLAIGWLPESVGGQGLGLLASTVIHEELGAGDPGAAFGLPGFGPYVHAVMELAPEADRAGLLAPLAAQEAPRRFGAVAWSEPAPCKARAGFVTTARAEGDGYVLDGQKCFVSGFDSADPVLVFAQVDEAAGWGGLGAFLVPAGARGLRVGDRHDTLSLDAASFGALGLEGVRVPASARLCPAGDFARATLRFFARYSLTVAARQVGLARAAFDLAREYCDVRKAFGKPIGHFQAIAFTLADRHIDVESARELVRRAAWSWDAGREDSLCLAWTAQAVAHAHEVAMRAADDAVQLHGGAGFIRDLVVEKMMRDAKQMALCGATAEQMDQLAAALAVGGGLDPALVLPTPDAQAVFT